MRIGIDARLYGTKHAGIGRYTAELIKNLEKIDSTNDYFIFLAKSNWAEYEPNNPKFTKVSADFKVYGVFEQLLYPFQLYSYKLDLVYFTHFNVPILYAKKYFVTIHDLIISHYPSSRATTLNPWLYKIKLLGYNFIVSMAAKRAKKIIAVSEFTKSDIVRLLKIRRDKISVVYEGVDLPVQANLDCQAVADKFGLDKDFLLYVGSAYPHKNLEKLIEAYFLIEKESQKLQLVLAGKKNFFYKRLEEWLKEKYGDRADQVILTDYLTDEELVCLYDQAKLYVFPSLIEGFGLPPLEAQSYGLPVLSSDKSCLPEILGSSALYFDSENVLDMAEKIESALKDESLRQQLKEQGLANIKKYSWSKMAREILSLYFYY